MSTPAPTRYGTERSAKSWVSECVKRFEEAGFLDWTPDKQLKPGARFFERRLADSTVQAGLPNAAISDGYDLITIDDWLVKIPSKTALVRVKGDSMIDAGIHEGDLLVVEVQPVRRGLDRFDPVAG